MTVDGRLLGGWPKDGLGSTEGLTDGSGSTVAGYSYDVFGAIRSQSGSSNNYWLFTGEQHDSESSFYYLRARYYDPAIGRFLSEDPLPFAQRYSYVDNSPANFVDPSGLCHYEYYDQVCKLAHETTTRTFSGEWKVFVGRLGSGEPGKVVNIRLRATVTWSGSGSVTGFDVSKEGSGVRDVSILYGAVYYRSGQSRRAALVGCSGVCITTRGYVGSAAVRADPRQGRPARIELKLSRSLNASVGTWISSDTLILDLQSGETSQNTCNPYAPAYANLPC